MKGLATAAAIAASSLVMSSSAWGQTWDARTELAPDSKSTCPKASLIYQFAVAGGSVTASPQGGGAPLTGTVAADGKVSIHTKTPALGQVIISGDTQTKHLQATSSVYPGCVYRFVSGDMNAGLASAYQGGIGDWALGRWEGRMVGNIPGVGLREYTRSVIVEKLPDGRVGCRYGTLEFAARQAWVPSCSVTATGMSLRTQDNASVEISRSGDTRLEGRVREATTNFSYTIFLARKSY